MSEVPLALQDKSIFQVVFSYLEKIYVFRSVQYVSRYFYEVVPVLIEALDPCVVYSIVATKNNSNMATPRQQKEAPVNCKSSVLETLINLGARCSNLHCVDFGSQTRMTNAQLSRALANCSDTLEAINFARCLQLTWYIITSVLTHSLLLFPLNVGHYTHVC